MLGFEFAVAGEEGFAGAMAVQDAAEVLAGDAQFPGGVRNSAYRRNLYLSPGWCYYFFNVTCHGGETMQRFCKTVNRKNANILKKLLSDLAERKGWSLPDLAKRLNTPYQTVYGYDRGDRGMPEEFAQKAAKLLGTTREELLQNYLEIKEGEAGYHTESVPVKVMPAEIIDTLLRALLAQVEDANEHESALLIEAVKALKAEKAKRKPAPPGANPAYKPYASSISPDEAAASAAAAEEALEIERRLRSRPSPGAGGTSGNKGTPSPGTSGPASHKQSSPGKARE